MFSTFNWSKNWHFVIVGFTRYHWCSLSIFWKKKTFCVILVLTAFVSNGVKKITESFTSLRGNVSMPLAFSIYIYQKVFNFSFIDCYECKSFIIKKIGCIDYLLNFYVWMIFLRIDNISNRLHASIFKICAKGFWFSATALFNNIYVITIKQVSH